MVQKEWNEILKIAEDLGEDCLKTIDDLGRGKFESMQNRLIMRFPSHENKSITEWVMAMWRYYTAIAGRQFEERELDKVARWAFYLLGLQTQVDDQYQSLLLTSGTLEDNKDIKVLRSVITGLENQVEEAELLYTTVKEFFKKIEEEELDKLAVLGYKRRLVSPIEDLVNESTQLAKEARRSLKAIEDLASSIKVDTTQVKSKQESQKSVTAQIESIEAELNLRVQRGQDSKEMWVTDLLSKGDRYAKENPQLFTWHCSECGWEGILAKRHPPEDTLVNAMSIWWTWCCPSCQTMLAYDRRHPQFERWGQQDIVFNYRAWELVCKKELSLVNMAHFLNTDPEWIMLAVTVFFDFEVPQHVKEEFSEREKSFLADTNEPEVQETGGVPDFLDGEDGEESGVDVS